MPNVNVLRSELFAKIGRSYGKYIINLDKN